MIWLLSSTRTGIVEAEPFHAARNLPDLLRRAGMRKALLDFIEPRLAQFLARKNWEEQVYGGLKSKSELRYPPRGAAALVGPQCDDASRSSPWRKTELLEFFLDGRFAARKILCREGLLAR